MKLVLIVIFIINTIIGYYIILGLMSSNKQSRSVQNCKVSFFKELPIDIIIPVRYYIDTPVEIKHYRLKVTYYKNVSEETDSTPNHTATNRFVYEGSCAISQDLFRKEILPGDLVYVVALKQFFIVEDTMHPRHTKAMDIFLYKDRPKSLFKKPFISDVYVLKITYRHDRNLYKNKISGTAYYKQNFNKKQ